MKNQIKWGVGFIIFGLLMVSLIDFLYEHEGEEVNKDAKRGVAKLFWAAPFILIGLAIIWFKNREDKIEKIVEG